MAKKLIVGNWKMHPASLREAKALAGDIKKVAVKLRHVSTVLCPPSIFLYSLTTNYKLQPTTCTLGAQDCSREKLGPYTGQLSAEMCAAAGASYIIIGHSERRQMGETNSDIARKINNTIDAGSTPILCVGERERDEHGFYLKFIEEQLTQGLHGVSKRRIPLVAITYEPVWAIGHDALHPATALEATEMSIYIRKVLTGIVGKKVALNMRVLYGGSADDKDAKGFLTNGGIDGLLVGRASLDAKKFCEILRIAEGI